MTFKRKGFIKSKINYFQSESQRKGLSRLSFIYGSKQFMFLFGALIIGSSAIGLAILQQSRDTRAAVGPPIPVTCTRTISSGTSIPSTMNSMSSGQTLCLSGNFTMGAARITSNGVTLSSAPGQQAKVYGQFNVAGSNNKFLNLYIDGQSVNSGTFLLYSGANNTIIQGNDITSTARNKGTTDQNVRQGICMNIGEAFSVASTGPQNTWIDRNRIFNCGWGKYDQAIYLAGANRTRVTNNYVYDNPMFALQFYPDSDNAVVENNIFDNNSAGITFSGEGAKASDYNILRNNIISNSGQFPYGMGYKSASSEASIGHYWGGTVGVGNQANTNCIFNSKYADFKAGRVGYSISGNITGQDPLYTNRSTKDFTLRSGSPCTGKAPLISGVTPPSPTPAPAPAPSPSPGTTTTVTPETIITNVDTPWSMEFAPDGKLYFTERAGRVRVYANGQLRSTPVLTISNTETLSAEEGLQGLALHPNFATNGWIYVYYTYTDSGGSMKNRVARYTLNPSTATVIGSPTTIVDGIPGYRFHNGGRIKFGPDGKLYIATGAATPDTSAQNKSSLGGKILRVNDDGTGVADNPFSENRRVYSMGHRNPQGLAWHPVTKELWSTEHGPSSSAPYCCNDEVNKIVAGGNYGWPRYYGMSGEDSTYSGYSMNHIKPVWTSGTTSKWAPGGAMFYTGTQLGAPWTNSLIFAGLGGIDGSNRALFRLRLNTDNRTPSQIDTLYKNSYGRLRDVVQGPDGSIYISTSNRDGRGSAISTDDRIIRLKPSTSTTTPPAPAPAPTPPPPSPTPTPPPPSPTPTPPPTSPSTQTPYTSAIAIPGRLDAENYDKGGQGVAYNDTTSTNQGGIYRADGVDIESNKTGGYNVGWVSSGEWLEFTTNTQAGTYDLTFRVATLASNPATWTLKDGATVLATATTTSTGGWYSFKDLVIRNVNITAGTNKVMRLEASGSALNIDYVNFIKQTTTAPAPTPSPSPTTQITVEAENATSCIFKNTSSTLCSSNVWTWSSSGASGGKFVALTSNGDTVFHRFSVSTSGTYRIGFSMKSQSYRGDAKVDAYIDGAKVASGTTLSSTFSYRYIDKYLLSGTHTIRLVFINDKCGNFFPRESCTTGYDRNVWVDQFKASKL